MNEIHHIHLGRQAYTISADAYKELQDYLEAIKKEVGKEVADEVELRMCELLTERGVSGKKVVLKKDVEYLKEQLGTPGDFSEGGQDEDTTSEQAGGPKRLFRDTHNAMVAGVAAGLAEYFNIDVIIVRLIFVGLTFFGGGGVLIYLVLWLLVPSAKTNSERLQMQGKPVTVEAIKQVVSRADVPGATRRVTKLVSPVVGRLVRIVLGIAGVALIASAIATLLGVLTAGLYMWTNRGEVFAGQAVFPIGTKQDLFLASGVVALFLLNVFVILAGLALFKRRWVVPAWASVALGGVLLAAIACTVALGLDTGHQIHEQFQKIHHTQTVSVSPFTKLDLKGKLTWYSFVPSSSYKVEYQYQGKPVRTFNEGVKDGMLTIDTSKLASDVCSFVCLYNNRDLHVVIYAPTLSDISVNGEDASFVSDQPLKQQELNVTIGQQARVNLNYINPGSVTVSNDINTGVETLKLTGLRQAYVSDEIGMGDGYMTLSRAGTVEITTNGVCSSPEGQSAFYLLSFPDKLTVNGHVFSSAGDLQATQRGANTDSQAYNCVVLGY